MTMMILPDQPVVASLWRYPVKSMQGEELNAAEVTTAGVFGDRRFAIVDQATGKVAGAKNPRKWPGFLQFRAAYVSPPLAGAALPAVRVTLPDGTSATSEEADLPKLLSEALGREVAFSGASDAMTASAEDLQVDTDEVIEWDLPSGTFFDCAPVHLVTTATLDRLRALYPAGGATAGGRGDDALRHDHAAAVRPAEGFRDPAHRRAAQQRGGRRVRRGGSRRNGAARGRRHGALSWADVAPELASPSFH
jgi:hypothetical protein